jgi:hypothetical protein
MGGIPIKITAFRFRQLLLYALAAVLPFTANSQALINPMERMDRYYRQHISPIIPITPTLYDPRTQLPAPAMPNPASDFTAPTRPKTSQEIDQQLERDLMETPMYRERVEWMEQRKYYLKTFDLLTHMSPDHYSLSDVVYLVENAFMDDTLSYNRFQNTIHIYSTLVKQILKREKLDTTDNVALNYGIQKLFSQSNLLYDPKTKQSITVPPFKYDLYDFRGRQDFQKVFASKLLRTGKGQCHSLPLIYLCLAQELGAKAWLSLAPQHSFIQFADKNGTLLFFETTNGNLVSRTWMTQSGYITAKAIQNKTYLDTLSAKQLYAQCLADLLIGYDTKFKYDGFADQLRQAILQLDPNNLTAAVVDANRKTATALEKIDAAGHPKESDLPKHPDAYKAYMAMSAAYKKIDDLGYQEMPNDAYQRWLKSIEQEKTRQENKEIKDRMQREVQALKRMHSTLVNKPRQ